MWALLSVLWSDYSLIGFKRWIQIFGSYIICISAVIYLDNETLIKYFRFLSYTYLAISFVAIITIPEASMDYMGSKVWRGLAPHKNLFGEIVLICTLISIFSIKYFNSKYWAIDYLMLVISLILLFGSKSMTSLLVLFIIGFIAFSADPEKRLGFGNLSKWLYFTFLSAIVFLVVSLVVIKPLLIKDIFNALGKNLTFTGRTELWTYIIQIAFGMSNPLLGVGYGSFWVYGSPHLNELYSLILDTPIQAHNGYVDLTIETGFIGLGLVLTMTIWYFYNLKKNNNVRYWSLFIIATLIINLQEATLFKVNAITGLLFIFSYVLLFSRLALPEYNFIEDTEKNDN